MSRWFRFYDEAINDPKVQRLPPELFKAWVNVLCLASKCNGKIPVEDVTFHLRASPEQAAETMILLGQAGLIVAHDGYYTPHNWLKRQYKSDSSKDRVKRFRKRQRNAECNVTVTPPETEQIQSRTDKKEAHASRGAALPEDWQPSDDDFSYIENLGFTRTQALDALEDMRLWAGANSNRSVGRKADWSKTYRGWMRRNSKRGATNAKTTRNGLGQALERLGDHIRETERGEEGGQAVVRLLSSG